MLYRIYKLVILSLYSILIQENNHPYVYILYTPCSLYMMYIPIGGMPKHQIYKSII